MCLPTLPDLDIRCQAGEPEPSEFDYQDARDRLPGWAPFENRAARRRSEKARARVSDPMEGDSSARAHEDRKLGEALHKSPNIAGRDRRRRPRTPGHVLSEPYRMEVRRLLRSASRCASTWRRFGRVEVGAAGDWEWRMSTAMRCKVRVCPVCEPKRREQQCARVEGDFSMFLTLTRPPAGWTIAESWEHVHEEVQVFMRELRREISFQLDYNARKTERGEAARMRRAIVSRSRIRCEGKLMSAWALENHKSGFPHVHMVLNTSWIDYDFVRELWGRACGSQITHVNGRKIWSINGACRYLSKYVSKGGMTADLLALLYRRRLWASTVPAKAKKEALWTREEFVTSAEAQYSTQERETYGARFGWRLQHGKDDAYAIWKRRLVVRAPRVLETQDEYQEWLEGELKRLEWKRQVRTWEDGLEYKRFWGGDLRPAEQVECQVCLDVKENPCYTSL